MGAGYHGGFGATRGSAYKKETNSNHTQSVTISLRKSDIINALMGVTEASSIVAELIKDKKIGVNILGDELFEATLDKNIDAKSISGYQERNQIRLRRSALKGYSNFVHEGTHAYDYLQGKITPSSLKGELRAYSNEHEYQIKKGEHIDFKDSDEILVHIKLNYKF